VSDHRRVARVGAGVAPRSRDVVLRVSSTSPPLSPFAPRDGTVLRFTPFCTLAGTHTHAHTYTHTQCAHSLGGCTHTHTRSSERAKVRARARARTIVPFNPLDPPLIGPAPLSPSLSFSFFLERCVLLCCFSHFHYRLLVSFSLSLSLCLSVSPSPATLVLLCAPWRSDNPRLCSQRGRRDGSLTDNAES